MLHLGYALLILLTFTATVMLEGRLIPRLRKNAAQPIYEEGPSWHLSKSGTPTMGGLGFLLPILLIGLACALATFFFGESYFARSLLITLSYAALNSLIGVIDDTAKIKKRENAGLSPLEKLLLQGGAAALFLISRTLLLGNGTSIHFGFGEVDLGIFYYPLVFVMLLGTVNCANLTDGIDGLASGVTLAVFTALGALAFNSNGEVSVISALAIGGAAGFLTVNLHPARIFMGDTGSLFLGSLAAGACVALGNPLIILSVGFVYLFEGISVILQVTVYKLTKKRVFKMAPYHHHLEKCGWNENKIVIWAIIVTLLSSLLGIYLFG